MDDSSQKKTIHSIQCQKWFDSIRFRSLQPSDWSVTELTSVVNTHTRLTALFPGLPGSAGTRKEKPIWILLKQKTVSGSGISWAICNSAHRSRQITTPAPHHSVFYRPDALPAAQPTASKHWSLPQRRHYVPIPNQLSKLTKLSIPSASKNH